MNFKYLAGILCLLLTLAGCKNDKDVTGQRDRNFNEGWKFVKDSVPVDKASALTPENPAFNDTEWQAVDLPHDWSIQRSDTLNNEDHVGPFTKSAPGATSTGYTKGGTGWYRKHFQLSKSDRNKTVILRFDGVYMETDVWVNGKSAGNHVYGYTPFNINITSLLNPPGENNVVAVRVSNNGRNSRWYTGSGIYRNVVLTVLDEVHIPVWSVNITNSAISDTGSTAQISFRVRNTSATEFNGKVDMEILAPDGSEVFAGAQDIQLQGESDIEIAKTVSVKNPFLWSPSSPALYKAIFTLTSNGKKHDQYIQAFGIRSIEITAEKGFLLNGIPMELKGGCVHHDNGLLGSAAFDRAEERKVQIMKNNGFNAIRTSHNPPSQAFLDACDRIGMMIIDETFDMWERPKNPQDYHRFFKEWWKKDVEAMIMRDRNHPCIIMWSIGNEINERADTSGIRIAKAIIDHIKQFDNTRPFTNAICDFWDIPGTPWEVTSDAFSILTVGGYNYQYPRYEADHEKFPQRIMMGTESVPKHAFENWSMVEKHPYVIGDFVWTGMDYLGETGIGHTQYFTEGQKDEFAMPWPWFNAWCGDIDIIGEKKPQMIYRDVLWNNSPLEMNVHAPVPEGKTEVISYWGWPDEYPHWNWNGNEGKELLVSVYSKADAVKLFLNGREIGHKVISPMVTITSIFSVPYEPGELKAIAYKNDKEIASKTFRTTGTPAAIRLFADRNAVTPSRSDLAFVTIEIIDEFGNVVTDAVKKVTISVSGNGELAGSGNACPWDMQSVGNTTINTFYGKAMVIVRPYVSKGQISIQARGDGLTDGKLNIAVLQ